MLLDFARDLNPVRKVAALERDVIRVLVTIRLAMNQAAPINRFPPEILTRTLEFREGDRDLISATQVCHRWRSALSAAPSLWTEVVFRDSGRVLTYLTRSKALPIDASFKPTRRSFETWKFDPEDFYTSRIPWIGRVKSLDIGGDEEQIEAIVRRLCLPAPLLQCLKFDGRPNRSMVWRSVGAVGFPHNFLGGQVPSLQSLSFNSISPTPTIRLPLPNLTSFTWIDKDSKVTLKELLTLLMSAPLLEVMNIHLRIRSVSTAERTTVVTLNKLRELTWSNSGGSFSLTSCLIAPELHWLSLRVAPAPESTQSDLASILPPHAGHFPLLVEPTEMRYITRRGYRTCDFTSETGYMRINVLPRNYDDATHWLSRDTPISFKRTRRVIMEEDYPQLGEIPTEEFESLESLELDWGAAAYFSMMRPYRLTLSGAPIIPFPTLSELRATYNANLPLNALVEVLMERKQAGHGIETVRIRGECAEPVGELRSKLKELVGELAFDLVGP